MKEEKEWKKEKEGKRKKGRRNRRKKRSWDGVQFHRTVGALAVLSYKTGKSDLEVLSFSIDIQWNTLQSFTKIIFYKGAWMAQ